MQDKLKVLVVGPYPREDGQRVGGVEVHISYLTDGLAARGDMDVHVMTAVAGLDAEREWRTPTGVTVHEVPICVRYQFIADSLINVPRMYRRLREIKPDFVHCHSPSLYARAALERGFPSVQTLHGVAVAEAKLAQRARSRFRGLYASVMEIRMLRRVKYGICLNQYSLNTFGKYMRAREVRLIDHGVDDRFFDLPSIQEPDRLLFAGRIFPLKNLLGLLKAAEIIVRNRPGLKLRVAGQPSDPDYYDQCVAFVEQRHLSDNVDFLGNIPLEALQDELARANMLVLPARQENSPVIISEALAAGRPVVATAAGGIPEVVKDQETGYIVPFDDTEALADRIERILADAGLRERLGSAAKALAEKRFRRAEVIERTVEFYRDILRWETPQ